MSKVIGKIDQRVIDLLGLSMKAGTPILIGESNEAHMKSEHPNDFDKYFGNIVEILASPDYVTKHPRKDSIEYIKVMEDHVLVAIRLTSKGVCFARTLFTMSDEKVEKYKLNPDILKKY